MSNRDLDSVAINNFVLTTVATTAPVLDHSAALQVRLTMNSGLQLLLEVRSAADAQTVRDQFAGGVVRLIVGDESELVRFDLAQDYANLVQIEVNADAGTVTFRSSFVGLPPVFLLQSGQHYAVTSPLLPGPSTGLPSGGLDLQAAADLLRWGHPIDGRTLARNVSIIPAASRVLLSKGAPQITTTAGVTAATDVAQLNDQQLLDLMCQEFAAHAARMNVENAVVSLSGGLDSRATAVALLQAGKGHKFVTLAANDRSLDAGLARAFCHRYGADHTIIRLDHGFTAGLTDRIQQAARLTYGVSLLHQSVDIFLYEQLGSQITRRVSGNLGNQVGRGGVESLTVSQPDQRVLGAPLRDALAEKICAPWFIDRMNTQGFASVLFQQEVSYWSVPNYVVGSRYAIQQMPYASHRLMALSAALYARLAQFQTVTTDQLRSRDLHHRLRGTPIATSFQRRFLIQNDRLAADVPINWGWKAAGGYSPGWAMQSFQAAIDAAAVKWSLAPGIKRLLSHSIPNALRRPYGLLQWPTLLRQNLKEFANDTLRSTAVCSSGAFDTSKLVEVLDAYYAGDANGYGTIAKALEIGCGAAVFKDWDKQIEAR